ncbi:MAG: hypothetical protein D6696_02875, partial [Acidobacteria bacterium]
AHHRGAPPSQIAELVNRRHPDLGLMVEDDLARAVHLALARATDLGATVLVAGGLFLAMEAAALLAGDDPHSIGW